MQPPKRVLDLFCGAGGAAMGLHQAWPEAEIVGVDVKPQPRYPFRFVQADAMEYPLEGFDFVWASPPCQKFTAMKTMWNAKEHPDLLSPIRERLLATGKPFVVENVPNAPLHNPVTLCGTMFNLTTRSGTAELRRHRLFEATFAVVTPSCSHNTECVIGVYGGHGRVRRRTITVVSKQGGYKRKDGLSTGNFSILERREAMGIDWMKDYELSQAVPPAYSRYIAEQYLLHSPAAGATLPPMQQSSSEESS